MKKVIEMMKIGDLIIVGLLVIFSFLPLAIFTSQQTQATTGEHKTYAVISNDGEEIYRMELKKDYIRESYTYEDEAGHMNIVVRDGEQVFIQKANCPDELCVQEGAINRVGETIVCLPHRLLVEVISDHLEDQNPNNIDFVS